MNPNKVTQITRTTSTEFITIFTFVSNQIAFCALGEYKRWFADNPVVKVEVCNKNIIVTQPLQK
jgi:hypothetical protein